MHLTNVSIQRTAPDYDPELVRKSGTASVPAVLRRRVWTWAAVIRTGTQVDDPAGSPVPHREARKREGWKTVRRYR